MPSRCLPPGNKKINEVLMGVTGRPDVAMTLRGQRSLLATRLWKDNGRPAEWGRVGGSNLPPFLEPHMRVQQPFRKSLLATTYFIRADVEMGLVPSGHWAL